jgi:hypothetical protein
VWLWLLEARLCAQEDIVCTTLYAWAQQVRIQTDDQGHDQSGGDNAPPGESAIAA